MVTLVPLQDDEAKQQKLLDVLRQEQGNLLGGGRMLIFVDTKKRCDQIQETVNKSRLVKSVAIHGDRDQVSKTMLALPFLARACSRSVQ